MHVLMVASTASRDPDRWISSSGLLLLALRNHKKEMLRIKHVLSEDFFLFVKKSFSGHLPATEEKRFRSFVRSLPPLLTRFFHKRENGKVVANAPMPCTCTTSMACLVIHANKEHGTEDAGGPHRPSPRYAHHPRVPQLEAHPTDMRARIPRVATTMVM